MNVDSSKVRPVIEFIRVFVRSTASRSNRLSLLVSFVSVLVLGLSSDLAAHDGVLFGQQPLIDSGEFLGGGTSYGLVLIEEGEALWTCDEVLEATPYLWRSLSSGVLLAGTDEGLRWSSDGGCSWELVEGLPGQLPIFSLTAHPSVPGRLLITTGSADQENHVFESLDDGQTWTSIFSQPEAALWRALWLADGESLFVEAVGQDGVPLIHVSLDGGTTWTDSPYSLGEWRSVGLFGVSSDESSIWFSGLSPEGAFALGTIPVGLDSTPQLLAIFPQPVTAFAEHEGLLHIVVGFSEYLVWSGVAQEDMQSVDAGVTACLQKIDGQLWGCGGEPMHSSFATDFGKHPLGGNFSVFWQGCPAPKEEDMARLAPPPSSIAASVLRNARSRLSAGRVSKASAKIASKLSISSSVSSLAWCSASNRVCRSSSWPSDTQPLADAMSCIVCASSLCSSSLASRAALSAFASARVSCRCFSTIDNMFSRSSLMNDTISTKLVPTPDADHDDGNGDSRYRRNHR